VIDLVDQVNKYRTQALHLLTSMAQRTERVTSLISSIYNPFYQLKKSHNLSPTRNGT
jgi:hypothetical protein